MIFLLILCSYPHKTDNVGESQGHLDPQRQASYDPYGRDRYRPPSHRDGYGHETYGPSPSCAGYDPYSAPPGGYPDAGQHMSPTPGMYQQGCVLMVYGLNQDKMNAMKLFNLFCLYGNIVRVIRQPLQTWGQFNSEIGIAHQIQFWNWKCLFF